MVTCFLSHKCGKANHAVAYALRGAWADMGVRLLIDPFEHGAHFLTKIATLQHEADALLFFFSAAATASMYCQAELEHAEQCRMPIFVARFSEDALPARFASRRAVDGAALQHNATASFALASSIRTRGAAWRMIRGLPQLLPEECRAAAQELAESTPSAVLAENTESLAESYTSVGDATARYWIAKAICQAGTPQSRTVLDRLSKWERHPLPLYAISRARDAG